ncbi:MAG: hypothetical protein VXX85_04170, partial [Candidatus Margulisiibacteriota bacterium]|nr:hypothetical protein [Candidatus Margulisiibacteriota bacterium]
LKKLLLLIFLINIKFNEIKSCFLTILITIIIKDIKKMKVINRLIVIDTLESTFRISSEHNNYLGDRKFDDLLPIIKGAIYTLESKIKTKILFYFYNGGESI